MSPAKKQEIIDRGFDATGGEDEYHNWIRSNRSEYYTKHWLRNVPRPVVSDAPSMSRMEDLLAKLDRGENAKVINGEFTEVEDAT